MVLKVYRFQKRAFLLTAHGDNWRQHRRNCRIGKTKTRWLYCVECPQYSTRLEALGCLCDCL